MMKTFSTLLCCFFCYYSLAQDLQGQPVFTASLSTVLDIDKGKVTTTNSLQALNVFDFRINTQLSFGKINSQNTLIAYGATLGYGYGSINTEVDTDYEKTTLYSFYPTLIVQKYIALSNRLYYSPTFNVQAGYQKTISKDHTGFVNYEKDHYGGSASFIPFGLTYTVKPTLNLLFQLGRVSLSYEHGVSEYPKDPNNRRGVGDNYNFSAMTNYFSFGIQRVF